MWFSKPWFPETTWWHFFIIHYMLPVHSVIQSPPKESIHFCRAEYSKLMGARWKVGGAPNPPLSWSKLGQASFWKFQNEAWSSLDKLKGGCGAPPTFYLATLDFEYLALPQVYTFFWWRLYLASYKPYTFPFVTKIEKSWFGKNVWINYLLSYGGTADAQEYGPYCYSWVTLFIVLYLASYSYIERIMLT